MSRVGIYGGTFDPIHLGHLHVISQLIEKKIVDQLLVVPAGEPLLRNDAPKATAQQRRAMCQLAVSDLPADVASKVQVNPIEVL
ncbi:MAG: adenylyltransferase/cytidyltransferase family protein, partial [Candidatus Planktophila sp.]|nr:adenylyltransferase/cytidyltransferase family protein [Candidatus Planktophila sp.]